MRYRVLAASLLVVALVVLTVAPAEAVTLSVPVAATTPPVNPSGPKGTTPRQFMLNTLGSVLGKVTPNSWKREQIAYNQRYNHDWETLEAQFGTDPANPDYKGSPDSYQDYVLKKLEADKKGGTAGKPMTVPATKLQTASKIAGGIFNGMSYVAAAETGFAVGKTFSRAIGMNVDAGLCDPGFTDFGLVALATGTDCSQQNAITPEYKAAAAANPSVTGGNLCIPDGSWCMQLVAEVPQRWSAGDDLFTGYCFVQSGQSTGADGSWRFQIKYSVLGSDSWAEASTGGVAESGRGYSEDAAYGCFAKGVPAYDRSTGTGGVSVTGVPKNGPVGATNDPLTYRFLNAFTSDISDTATAVDASSGTSTVQCSITGSDGHIYTDSTAPYPAKDGKAADPVCPDLPDGVTATHLATEAHTPQGVAPMQSADTTQAYQDWYGAYPECRSGACKLDLVHLKDGVAGKSCFDDGTVCNGWFDQPSKASDYQCTYGTHVVDQAECAVYSGVFDPARLQAGAPYSDPMTGIWSGAANAPTPDRQAFSQGAQDPSSGRSCNGLAATSFDPVAWVMRPIQCALEWAFVPRPAVVQVDMGEISTGFDNTSIGKVVTAVQGWKIHPHPSGCRSDMNFPVPMTHQVISVPIIEACPGTPMADFAGWIRGLVSAGLAITAAFACKRIVNSWLGS